MIHLTQDFRVCTEGEAIKPEEAKILKFLEEKLSVFQVNLCFTIFLFLQACFGSTTIMFKLWLELELLKWDYLAGEPQSLLEQADWSQGLGVITNSSLIIHPILQKYWITVREALSLPLTSFHWIVWISSIQIHPDHCYVLRCFRLLLHK